MATYVLVHGGWSGAHGFRHVRRMLHAAGHEVFTPSLTGIGERVHLVSPQVDLSTHIADVVNAVLYEDLDPIVLLGYSYGGAVVTGALRHIADRVRELVYLDAFVPEDGDIGVGTRRPRGRPDDHARRGVVRAAAAAGSTTTRSRAPGSKHAASPIPCGASPSRSDWTSRSRSTRSG